MFLSGLDVISNPFLNDSSSLYVFHTKIFFSVEHCKQLENVHEIWTKQCYEFHETILLKKSKAITDASGKIGFSFFTNLKHHQPGKRINPFRWPKIMSFLQTFYSMPNKRWWLRTFLCSWKLTHLPSMLD